MSINKMHRRGLCMRQALCGITMSDYRMKKAQLCFALQN